jgi:nucleotide-binding universal stress UspA family protein
MRILFAADEHPYSEFALQEMIRLAMNTWADVTLLGVNPASAKESSKGAPWPGDLPVSRKLGSYRETFLASWEKGDSPYETGDGTYEWIPVKQGVFEEIKLFRGRKKEFKVRMRSGNPSAEILAEAGEDGTDLIVIGCPGGGNCVWADSKPVPQDVVSSADCSVLLVKEKQPVTRILACLDQGYISQESLEMINQMATIHGVPLELVGLSQNGDMNKAVYTRLIEIGDYYSDREVQVNTRLMEIKDFEQFISQETHQNLVALWMGKKSLLSRFYSGGSMGRFVGKSQSSVLVMR